MLISTKVEMPFVRDIAVGWWVMVSKRDKFSIILSILQACRESTSKTNIVYQANLNFRTVAAYLGLLVDKGMIEVIQKPIPLYRITPKGTKMMNDLKSIKKVLGLNDESVDRR